MFVTTAHAESHTTQNANTEVAGHSEGQAGGSFPPFDPGLYPSQLLWLAITFGIFYLLVSKVIAPRIGGILEDRHDRIAEDLDEANRLKEESDAAVAAYEQDLADARRKANEIATTSREKAKAESDAERAKHEDALNKKLAESEANVAAVKAKALAEVDGIAGDTAQAIVEQLLGGKVTKAEVTAAVRDVVK
ncbi:MAG: F0F1 ATP synthase subunit B [Lentilitoribacter sp.]|jgi:F-type H+-transporting ATPase subunit b|mmetsp:Transcript_26439/g.34434  ORF Transcript_26439/g.34434 Transcript_26439/m.34434 type:complete len:192 (+) Transcript_26439:444-1019(+)